MWEEAAANTVADRDPMHSTTDSITSPAPSEAGTFVAPASSSRAPP